MIEVLLIGGIGNCLFQYAAGRSLAVRHNTCLCLNASRHHSGRDARGQAVIQALHQLKLEARFSGTSGVRARWLEPLRFRGRRERFGEKGWGFDPAFLTLGDDTLLFGYFQSIEYWKSIETMIRSEIVLRELPGDSWFRSLAARIDAAEAVSVHVRRGDYLRSPLHNVCGEQYYRDAMRRISELVDGPVFFVFSDDLDWCRGNLAGNNVVFVDSPVPLKDSALEMHLMSRCRHQIISNSTYSWWAAWLNSAPGNIVIVPDRWFNEEAMNTSAMRDTVLSQWRRIGCGIPFALEK